MRLCLSARAFALRGGGYSISVAGLVALAKETGYDGITLRRGQLDETTPEAEVERIRDLLRDAGAPCSFVTGAAVNDETSWAALCTIVDRAAAVGAPVVQPTVRDDAEIPWMRRAADHAAARAVSLAPQLHNRTRHERAEQAVALVDAIGRPNFGVAFEGAHLLLQQRAVRDGAAVRLLGPRIKSVCVQNYRLAPGEADAGRYEGTPYKPALPDDPRGVDLPGIFAALKEIGYDGFVTVMAGSYPGMDNRTLFARYARVLRLLL
jgi:sugar phosphate isomerase/epimerase